MPMLWPIPRGQFRLLIHNPGVPVISRTAAHQKGGRPIDNGADGTIRGALTVAIQKIENLIQLLVGHTGMSERLRLNAIP